MDEKLCDELLQEIFTRLPPTPLSSSLSIPLVSKRWLHLYRASKTSLSIRVDPQNNSVIPTLSSLLSRYSSLSSLSLLFSSFDQTQNAIITASTAFSDQILLMVFLACSNLTHLRFLLGPVSPSSLFSLSNSCSRLASATLSLSRPVSFRWVAGFPCLKDLSVYICSKYGACDEFHTNSQSGSCSNEDLDSVVGLESISLSGIRADDLALGWLWRSSKNLKRLKLKECSSIGDIRSFASCLQNLEEIELRTCRSIVDVVLLNLAEYCSSLSSLLIYDGGSAEGLLQFLNNSRFNLQKLDLRLPLDLNDNHLSSIAANFRALSILRLQSCCLVTGEGLKTLAVALSSSLEELALVNCNAVEREPGMLTTLGQHFKKIRTLELSYNELLPDKELISTLVSCCCLVDLKLRGCKALTGLSLVTMLQSCKQLKSIDIVDCRGIETEAVELFVRDSPRLRRMRVEGTKLSNAARFWVSHKFIELVA